MRENVNPNGSVLVFGGTIEGRRLSDYLVAQNIPHTVSVATEYGEEVLEPQPCRKVQRGRMDEEKMREFLRTGGYHVVVDATHPYAVEVSRNICAACQKEKLPYLRYLRPQAQLAGDGGETAGEVWVDSAREAAEYLEGQKGRIFLTTGSKELHVFTEIITDRSRLFARVLPSAGVIASCRELGLEGKQICGMQGPFSQALNEAMLLQAGADFLVTKNTGTSGGFSEKIEAARKLGVCPVIIRRPEEAGSSFEEVTGQIREILRQSSDCSDRKEDSKIRENGNEAVSSGNVPDTEQNPTGERGGQIVSVRCIGIGMGTPETLTQEAAQAIRSADILFGAKRILESVIPVLDQKIYQEESKRPDGGKPVLVEEYIGEKIAAYLHAHPGYRRPVILMSGDVGFYSGARGIAAAFPEGTVRYYCGISSVVYFASKIPTAWQDAKLLSAHGKQIHLLNCVQRYPKIIMLVSGAGDVERICRELTEAGMERVRVTVGSNLSYPEEKVISGAPSDFLKCSTAGLHIMMLENPEAYYIPAPGVADDEFVRGKVPMTKEEIRILSVSKLHLTEDAVVCDVGAGTGSVSVECARLCTSGTVYAIERNPEGIGLIRENSRKLRVSNVIPVEGLAPEALEPLPAPTHAFIGGSSGNMREIIKTLRRKNPDVRIVINTIALESIAEVMQLLKEFQAEDADILQVSAARSRILGRYHMMTAQNPVYIISFGGR